MKFDNHTSYYFDHDRFREAVRQILETNHLKETDIATSLGYTAHAVSQYLCGRNDSRFMAGALCTKFKLNPKDFTKKGYRT